ncbi:MAG: hypothetical protein JOZ15_00475 [Acidobacteria bacterium]|nr:hypothetical protein [Acidobacteriota bacterium]
MTARASWASLLIALSFASASGAQTPPAQPAAQAADHATDQKKSAKAAHRQADTTQALRKNVDALAAALQELDKKVSALESDAAARQAAEKSASAQEPQAATAQASAKRDRFEKRVESLLRRLSWFPVIILIVAVFLLVCVLGLWLTSRKLATLDPLEIRQQVAQDIRALATRHQVTAVATSLIEARTALHDRVEAALIAVNEARGAIHQDVMDVRQSLTEARGGNRPAPEHPKPS